MQRFLWLKRKEGPGEDEEMEGWVGGWVGGRIREGSGRGLVFGLSILCLARNKSAEQERIKGNKERKRVGQQEGVKVGGSKDGRESEERARRGAKSEREGGKDDSCSSAAHPHAKTGQECSRVKLPLRLCFSSRD